MKRKMIFCLMLSALTHTTYAQLQEKEDIQRHPSLPDIPGYKTLKCDFHMHTVFSDGHVWPSFRVNEALRDGLDRLSIVN